MEVIYDAGLVFYGTTYCPELEFFNLCKLNVNTVAKYSAEQIYGKVIQISTHKKIPLSAQSQRFTIFLEPKCRHFIPMFIGAHCYFIIMVISL